MSLKASASVRLAAANSGAVYAQMLAGVGRSISIRNIVLVARTNVTTEVGLARAHSVGTASAGNVATGIAHRGPNATGVFGSVEYGWNTNPTGVASGTAFIRREVFAAPTGGRLELWRYEDAPLAIEPTGCATGFQGLLLQNVGSAAGAALDVHVVWEYGAGSDN